MSAINICNAKAQFYKLVEQAAAGNDVVIARHGKPVARLTRFEGPKRKLKFGVLKGEVKIAVDFDAALPEEALP